MGDTVFIDLSIFIFSFSKDYSSRQKLLEDIYIV